MATVVTMLLPAAAYAGDPAAAREQLKAGYTLAQDGRCAEAIPRFQESLKLDAKAITLINLAQCEERTQKLADALGHWVDARARAQSEGNAAIEEEAEKRAKALEPRLPRLTIALTVVMTGESPKDLEIVRDGVVLGSVSVGVALPVNPGPHTIVVRAPGYEETTKKIDLAEGENKRIDVGVGKKKPEVKTVAQATTTPEKAAPKGTNPLVYVGFGTAVAGVAVGAVTGIMAFGKASTAKDNCPNLTCPNNAELDAVDSGRTLGTISTIGFAVAGVGAAVGIYGLLAGGSSKSSATVGLTVGPTGCGIRGSF
ncbi:hypothetical protein AKJ09_03457 [Labilithrix luteola]|uniref:PEGA domain-containing protein n=1 Tax=Labilithrix luteola TaxID=1391654 RepID=A0A0K1PTD1_9BACT|nr:hypothetical protein AKJ09_03457 [Labilithrix luteola]